tara:strand:- start:147 stop:320 length:174 start_codon:yes stop_codon:yes gene_type:complete
MKPGDLVKHFADGALGVCVGVDDDEYLITWFDGSGGLSVSYNTAAAMCHTEVINEAR